MDLSTLPSRVCGGEGAGTEGDPSGEGVPGNMGGGDGTGGNEGCGGGGFAALVETNNDHVDGVKCGPNDAAEQQRKAGNM